jgi:hypothetical protein
MAAFREFDDLASQQRVGSSNRPGRHFSQNYRHSRLVGTLLDFALLELKTLKIVKLHNRESWLPAKARFIAGAQAFRAGQTLQGSSLLIWYEGASL